MPSGGIPINVEFRGWPTSTSPLEVHVAGAPSPTETVAKETPTPQPALTRTEKWDYFYNLGLVVVLISVSGGLGGLLNAAHAAAPSTGTPMFTTGMPVAPSSPPSSPPPKEPKTKNPGGEAGQWRSLKKEMLSSIVAAFIVPGVIYFIQKELLTSAPINPYDALALMSLCLIAATIGNPFIDFVQAEARWWMAERTKQRDALKKFTDEAKETLQQLENKMKELEQQGTQSTDQGG